MKIAHFSTWDISGGAARAAYRLHQSLRSLGHDSRLVVLSKNSTDDSVIPLVPSRQWTLRLPRGLRRRYLSQSAKCLASLPSDSTIFTDDRSQFASEPAQMAQGADVINLHWVAGFVDYRHFFPALTPHQPVVWTLHDMNPFTGGCHYSFECDRFVDACGSCPQLPSPSQNDLSHRIWQRKHRAYKRFGYDRLHFVTPSRWLAGELRCSSLLKSAPLSAIPNSVDLETFQPHERPAARRRFGIALDAKTILFVADSAEEKRKGAAVLMDALSRLPRLSDLYLVTIGRGKLQTQLPVPSIALGPMADDRSLALAYSAADVLVLPSLQDNFPNTALEALACGLPVVGSRVGGIPEIVRPDFTGLLVEPENPEALASAITELLGNEERRKQMSVNCRRVAVGEYSLEIQARRYSELYEMLLRKQSVTCDSGALT